MTDLANEISAVNERLSKLERQNRRLRLGIVAAGVIAGALVLTGALPSTPQTVTAQKFVLFDLADKIRAELGVVDGSPGLLLSDVTGMPRASLALFKSGEPALVSARTESRALIC